MAMTQKLRKKQEKENAAPKMMLTGGTTSVSSATKLTSVTQHFILTSNKSIPKVLMAKSEIRPPAAVEEEDPEKT